MKRDIKNNRNFNKQNLAMKNISLLITGAFVLLTNTTCKKSGPSNVLPPITQTGANTFGCKINGQLWVPSYKCNSYCTGCVELDYNIHPVYDTSMLPLRLAFQAGNSEGSYSGIFSIGPANPRGFAIQDLSYIYVTGNVADSMEIDFNTNSGIWTTKYFDSTNIFQITKLDTVNKIISGTFSFTLYSSPTDYISVTDGRFDFKIGQYSHCSN